jgi:hypothetical protein
MHSKSDGPVVRPLDGDPGFEYKQVNTFPGLAFSGEQAKGQSCQSAMPQNANILMFVYLVIV